MNYQNGKKSKLSWFFSIAVQQISIIKLFCIVSQYIVYPHLVPSVLWHSWFGYSL